MSIVLLRLFVDVLELALFIIGIVALIRGKFSITASIKTAGWPARLAGIVAMLMLPATIVLRILLAGSMRPPSGFYPGQPPFDAFVERFLWLENLVYFGVFAVGVVMISGIVAAFRNCAPPAAKTAPPKLAKNPFESPNALPIEPSLPSGDS